MSDDQVKAIIKILLEKEENLSDGYHFYLKCDRESLENKLGEISKLILVELFNEYNRTRERVKLITQVKSIIKILLEKEEDLSDGYHFYLKCDRGESLENILGEISKLILVELYKVQKERSRVEKLRQEEPLPSDHPNSSCMGCYFPNLACRCDRILPKN
jgi:hypothetical protein